MPVQKTMTNVAVDDWMTIRSDTMMMSVLSRKTKSRIAVTEVTAKRAVFVSEFGTCSNYHCSTWIAMAVPGDGKTVNPHDGRMILARVHDDRNLSTNGSAEIGAKNVKRKRRFALIPSDDSTLAAYGNAVAVGTATEKAVDAHDGTLKKKWTCVHPLEVCKSVAESDGLLLLSLVHDHSRSELACCCCANPFYHSDFHENKAIRVVLGIQRLRFGKRQS